MGRLAGGAWVGLVEGVAAPEGWALAIGVAPADGVAGVGRWLPADCAWTFAAMHSRAKENKTDLSINSNILDAGMGIRARTRYE